MKQAIGELIRERRLGLGLSLGQLATEVSTTANQVRRWERGEQMPDEEARAALAAFLELDLAIIEEVAVEVREAEPDPDELAEPDTPTELVSAASGVALTSVSQPDRPDTPPEPDLPAVPTPAGVVGVLPETEPEPEVEAEPEPITEPTAQPPGPSAPAPLAPHLEAPRPVPLRYPESVPIGVAVEIAEPEPNPWNPLRYLYDPEKPWLYWIRAALTVVVLLLLANILFDSVGELFDKIGEFFDTIEPIEGVEEPVEEALRSMPRALS